MRATTPIASAAGFTLVELVIVITLLGAIAAVLVVAGANPFQAYADMRQRAALLTEAENAMQNLARELRAALPHSIRISGTALELLRVAAAGRYRTDAPGEPLDFTAADASFQAFGQLNAVAGTRAVIYHTGQTGANAYAGDSVITPAGTSVTVTSASPESTITLGAPHLFPFDSPDRRFYLIDSPVSFICDPAAGTLTLYSGYAIQAAQPVNAAAAPLNAAPTQARVVNNVTGCSFTFTPGAPNRSAVVTLDLTLSRDNTTVRLLQQVHVVNGA